MNTKCYEIKTKAILALASLAATTGTVKKIEAQNNIFRFAKLMKISLVSVMLLSIGLRVSPAHALRATPPPEKGTECLGDLQGTISSTPQPIPLWQTGTLRWNVTVPSSCTGIGVKLYVDNQVVSPTGSRTIQPIANTSSELHATLPAVLGGGRRTLATTSIKVDLPEPPAIITINANYMVPLLLQALREENKSIFIENHVELDLSGYEGIAIGAGVTLAGGRTPREPGPRLYTTTRPRMLFNIAVDNVRITGVRIEGPDMDVPDEGGAVGIYVGPTVPINNIEIDHNELSGWSWAAVQVQDEHEKIDYAKNPEAVRIHDNFIHHNQHVGKNGYGVAVGHGAYALIERNVFDYNRHAISGEDGSNGSGYRAYKNLVLEHGGYHDTYDACDLPDWVALVEPEVWVAAKALCIIPIAGAHPSYTHYTHQFDMHGQENCGISGTFNDAALNCGTAGEYIDIQYNSFFYTKGHAIKLRGTPEGWMSVGHNVFAHDSLKHDAVDWTETGPFLNDNLVGVNGLNELGTCDFDGDGLNDSFLATGQTWWYSSGGDTPWVYLNTSTKRRAEVTLGQFDGDGRCDVLVDGIIFPGGKTPKSSVKTLPLGGGVVGAVR